MKHVVRSMLSAGAGVCVAFIARDHGTVAGWWAFGAVACACLATALYESSPRGSR